MCRRCRRPSSVCYCAALPTIPTATRVVILQHPRERDMPIGTARMASLCLPNAELHVGIRWGESPALAAALGDPARPPILLYPGPGAKDILRDPPAGAVTLVVVDGTWSQAKTVVRDNPILQALPRYAFAAPAPSQYRIRKEPKAEYVSTIEALMYVLGALERRDVTAMLDPLNAMVDAQIAAAASSPRRFTRQLRQRNKPKPPPPPGLAARFGDLVVIAAEANAWPYEGDAPRPLDELVHLVAHRPATGESFSAVVAPAGELAPSTHFHARLSREELLAGQPREGAMAAFAAWSRPSDLVAAWGHYAIATARGAGATFAPALIDLRAVAQQRLHKRLGTLEGFTESLVGALPPSVGAGRAGLRVAAMAAIVRHWRAELAYTT